MSMPIPPQAKDNWQYRKMVAAERANIESQSIYESLGLKRAPNQAAALLKKMERSEARRMPTLFGTAGREGQAFEALAWMEAGSPSRLEALMA